MVGFQPAPEDALPCHYVFPGVYFHPRTNNTLDTPFLIIIFITRVCMFELPLRASSLACFHGCHSYARVEWSGVQSVCLTIIQKKREELEKSQIKMMQTASHIVKALKFITPRDESPEKIFPSLCKECSYPAKHRAH